MESLHPAQVDGKAREPAPWRHRSTWASVLIALAQETVNKSCPVATLTSSSMTESNLADIERWFLPCQYIHQNLRSMDVLLTQTMSI
jgi:hypothetical protein